MKHQLTCRRVRGGQVESRGLTTTVSVAAHSSYVCTDIARGIIVAKVIEYLSYKVQYADFATGDITEDFTERIPPEIALEL